jgi:hypothetical protein
LGSIDVSRLRCGVVSYLTLPDASRDKNVPTSLGAAPNLQVSLSGKVLANQSFGGFAAEINAILGNKTLTSLSAFRKWDEFDTSDGDQTTVNAMDLNSGEQAQRQFTQEFRVAGVGAGDLDWVAGLFYFDEDVESTEIWAGTRLQLFGGLRGIREATTASRGSLFTPTLANSRPKGWR